MINFKNELDQDCFKEFEPVSKVGLICAFSPDGYPHITLVSSISAKTEKSIMWGQFSRGLSKDYVETNPKTAFAILTPDRHWRTGKATYTSNTEKGPDYEYYNNQPMFRYNSYFGIGVVHYEEVIDISDRQALSVASILAGSIKSNLAKMSIRKTKTTAKLPQAAIKLANQMGSLIFIAYEDTDGYPRIIPALQGCALDGNNLVFSLTPYGEYLKSIPENAKVAVYVTSLELAGFLLQGTWCGVKKHGCISAGVFTVDKVYNPMLPIPHYIYPQAEIKNVFGKI
ncbi:MAG: hypothetical protein LBU04_07010 [Christensenellaceae bacterium]|jgi:hypothetical protein|nr:hypothetical protein [Christensenellaceae bacterium]